MSETLHKLQVVIEGNSSKLTQATREAMQETRRMTNGINAELKKISSPFAGMKSNPVREITRGIRDMMKQMQIASGMKVYTDDYKKLRQDIKDTEKELDALTDKMEKMSPGESFVPTQEFKALEKNIQDSSFELEKLIEKREKMEQFGQDATPNRKFTELGKNIQETDSYREVTEEIAQMSKKLQEYRELRSALIQNDSALEESAVLRENEQAYESLSEKLRKYEAELKEMENSGQDVKASGKWKPAEVSVSFTGMESNPARGINRSIRDMMKQMQVAAGMKVYTDDYKKLRRDIDATEKELDNLTDKMEKMSPGESFVPTQEFKDLEKNIQKSSDALEKLIEKQAKMERLGQNVAPTSKFTELEKNIQKTSDLLEKLNKRRLKMEGLGKDTVFTKEYQDALKERDKMERQLSSLQNQQEGLELSKDYQSDSAQKKTENKLEILRAKIKETQESIDFLNGDLKDMQETGSDTEQSNAYRELNIEITEAEKKLQEYKALKKSMLSDGSYQRETDSYREVIGEITRMSKKLQEYQELRSALIQNDSALEESVALRKNEQAYASLNEKLREYEAELENLESSGGDVKISDKWKNAATSVLSKTFAGMKATLGQVTVSIKIAGGAFASLIWRFMFGVPIIRRFNNEAKKNGNIFGGGLKSLLAYGFGIRSLYMLMNKARTAITDGFKNLAKHSSSTNAELSSLTNGLNLLKNSLASAFSPILSAIAPALETLINYCVNAINAIGQLFAALTGQGTYYKAVKGNQDFAAGLDKSANKANDSAKALKNTLMGFDEINKLDDDSSSGGSGSGSGGSGSSGSFDMVPVENAYADFAKQIKEAWANADFTELGGIFGAKIRDALDSIPWDEIKKTAQKVGASLATFINGAVETSGLSDAVGKTVAELLNTGVAGADSFMTNLHWDSVGQFVADSMNSFVKKADWKGIGTAVKDGINGVITAKATWADAFDFKAAGDAVKTAVKNALTGIKWTQANTGSATLGKGVATALNSIMTTDTFSLIGESAAGAVNTVISGAYTFIGTIDFKGWGKSIAAGINSYFKDLDWAKAGLSFSKAVDGILDTLLAALQGTDWRAVGSGIATALSKVDWKKELSKIGQVIWEAIKAAITTALEAAKKNPDLIVDLSALLVFKFVSNAVFKQLARNIVTNLSTEISGLSALEIAPIGIAIGGIALASFNAWANDFTGRDQAVITGIQTFFNKLGSGFESFAQSDKTQSFITTVRGALQKVYGKLGIDLGFGDDGKKEGNIDININAKDNTEKGVNSANTKLSTINEQETAEIEANDNTEPGVSSAKKGLSEIPKEKEVTLKLNKGDFGGGGRDFSIGVEAKVTTPASMLRQNILNGWNSLGNTTVQLGTKLLSGSSSSLRNEVWSGWSGLGNTNVSVGTALKSGSSRSLRDSVKNGWSSLKSTAVSVGTYLRGGATRGLRDSVLNGWNGLGGVSVSTGLGIRDSSNDLWNKVQNLWNNYGAKQTLWFKVNPTAASWTPGQKATGGLYTSGQWRPITAAASGGAFSTGQMFIAREAGPELVGSIGRSTAVMNNTQIVSSVAAGVYSAVVSAFSQYAAAQNGQSGTANINVYVGGKQVTDVVIEEVNRRTSANGVCPIRT